MNIYTAYGERAPKIKYIPGKSKTKQAMAAETNINFIIDRYQKTGSLEHLKKYEGEYGIFEAIDFHTAMNSVAKATEMFDELPSNIRTKFENDPGKFLDYATNTENHQGMVDMGLAYPKEQISELENEPVPDLKSESILEAEPKTVTT